MDPDNVEAKPDETRLEGITYYCGNLKRKIYLTKMHYDFYFFTPDPRTDTPDTSWFQIECICGDIHIIDLEETDLEDV